MCHQAPTLTPQGGVCCRRTETKNAERQHGCRIRLAERHVGPLIPAVSPGRAL